MNKIITILLLLFVIEVSKAQTESSKVGIRPLPRNKGEEVNGALTCGNYDDLSGQYPFVSANMFSVMDYSGNFITKNKFFEFYLPTDTDWINTDPCKNSLITEIRNNENAGGFVEHILICREAQLLGKGKWGPIPGDSRILYPKDVSDYRKLFKDAKALGLVKYDNYKLIQMVRSHSVFYLDTNAQKIIKSMDGVVYECHHFGDHWPLTTGVDKDFTALALGAQWTINQGKDYIFYYGPYIYKDCAGYIDDTFKDWLNQFWAAGLPKYSKYMHYYMNAFPFACGNTRPIGPETDAHSVLGLAKWLIQQVTGTTIQTTYWHFASSLEGWNALHNLTSNVTNSLATLTITGTNPTFYSPDYVNMSTNDYKHIVVSMQNKTTDNTAQLMWTTTTSTSFDSTKTVNFPIIPNDTIQRYYIIDLSAKPNWTGTIKQIRLNPVANVSSGSVILDFIKFAGTYPSSVTSIPGIIEAENYDRGGQGNAYNDADSTNNGGQYRSEAVDIQATSDVGGGYNVGWINTGEWLEYLIKSTKTAIYSVTTRIASSVDSNQFNIDIDGIDQTGIVTITNTGGPQTYADFTKEMTIPSGLHIIRLLFDKRNGMFNVNKLTVSIKIDTQTIVLQKGWNIISTNLCPVDSSIATIFASLDVQEIKTTNTFWEKGQNAVFNKLNTLSAGQGYLVKMNAAGTIKITGTPFIVPQSQFAIKSGWQLMGCPYQNPTSLASIFNANNTKAIKNFNGFWIPNNSTNSIQNLEPSKGYFIQGK